MYVHTYSFREEIWNMWLIFKLTYNILKFYYAPDPEGNLNTFQNTNIMQGEGRFQHGSVGRPKLASSYGHTEYIPAILPEKQ